MRFTMIMMVVACDDGSRRDAREARQGSGDDTAAETVGGIPIASSRTEPIVEVYDYDCVRDEVYVFEEVTFEHLGWVDAQVISIPNADNAVWGSNTDDPDWHTWSTTSAIALTDDGHPRVTCTYDEEFGMVRYTGFRLLVRR